MQCTCRESRDGVHSRRAHLNRKTKYQIVRSWVVQSVWYSTCHLAFVYGPVRARSCPLRSELLARSMQHCAPIAYRDIAGKCEAYHVSSCGHGAGNKLSESP